MRCCLRSYERTNARVKVKRCRPDAGPIVKRMRVYINSKNRTLDSNGPSDFNFALNRPIELPEGSRGYIDSFVCSNVWETVQPNYNNRFYCTWANPALPNSTPINLQFALNIENIASTDYLATMLTSRLSTLSPTGQGVLCAAEGTSRIRFSCPTLVGEETFTVWARTSLLKGEAGLGKPSGGYTDACEIVGAMTRHLVCRSATAAANLSRPTLTITPDVVSQYINLQPFQTIYLHSHIGTPESYGPSGETTVIASIVVGNTVPGDLVTHHHNGLVASPIDLPPLIGIMHFSLRTWNGRILDMQGHDTSFTLVIDTANI